MMGGKSSRSLVDDLHLLNRNLPQRLEDDTEMEADGELVVKLAARAPRPLCSRAHAVLHR